MGSLSDSPAPSSASVVSTSPKACASLKSRSAARWTEYFQIQRTAPWRVPRRSRAASEMRCRGSARMQAVSSRDTPRRRRSAAAWKTASDRWPSGAPSRMRPIRCSSSPRVSMSIERKVRQGPISSDSTAVAGGSHQSGQICQSLRIGLSRWCRGGSGQMEACHRQGAGAVSAVVEFDRRAVGPFERGARGVPGAETEPAQPFETR
ncbi:MAG: hypothetical protein MZV64_10350 [Ignavibacteriales bacterium]|nr:hypothetical protein [Ignavibacteriales bacterium]